MEIPLTIRLIVTVFFLSILPAQVYALTPAQVFDKVKDTVVVVITLDAQGKSKVQGSGVLLPSGKIATNCHVVKGGTSYQVGRDKLLVSATLFAEDGDMDICLLDAKGIQGKPAHLGKAVNLKVGDPVYAVGTPRGLELSISDGIVSQLRGGSPPFIQTTAAISPGSSGGGLFDREGRLVGITTFYLEGGQSLNFAMPVEWVGEVKKGRKLVTSGLGKTEWLKAALALAEKKDWNRMLDWCLKWSKSQPKDDNAWYCLGFAYIGLNRYDDAIETYRHALRNNPNSDLIWFALGHTYLTLKRYDDAKEAYRQILRINPNSAATWSTLGSTYSVFNRYEDAIEAYRQALRINPEYVQSLSGLGYIYFKLDHYHEAIKAYRQAILINFEDTGSWRGLGLAYQTLNRYEDAIEAYRQAVRLDPNDAQSWLYLGLGYVGLKRHGDAIEAVRQALRINPENADSWLTLGMIYNDSGNRTAALDAVRKLRRLDPEKADELFNLIVPR
jgi:tetratricopeptide (TPR) repeat protein